MQENVFLVSWARENPYKKYKSHKIFRDTRLGKGGAYLIAVRYEEDDHDIGSSEWVSIFNEDGTDAAISRDYTMSLLERLV